MAQHDRNRRGKSKMAAICLHGNVISVFKRDIATDIKLLRPCLFAGSSNINGQICDESVGFWFRFQTWMGRIRNCFMRRLLKCKQNVEIKRSTWGHLVVSLARPILVVSRLARPIFVREKLHTCGNFDDDCNVAARTTDSLFWPQWRLVAWFMIHPSNFLLTSSWRQDFLSCGSRIIQLRAYLILVCVLHQCPGVHARLRRCRVGLSSREAPSRPSQYTICSPLPQRNGITLCIKIILTLFVDQTTVCHTSISPLLFCGIIFLIYII